MNTLILVQINKSYCDYLRSFDAKVPYNYDKKKNRPFIGVLFAIDNIKYFAPLSSPKPKHLKLKSKIDFMKIDGGKLGAINFNNMIPVLDEFIVPLDLNKIKTTKEEVQYFKLLEKQLNWLNRNSQKLFQRARSLYQKYMTKELPVNIYERCCDFPLLEKKCLEYQKVKN